MENKYFAELARRLRAAGITAGHPEKNRLTVLLNNQPVLSVSAGSDVFLLPAGSNNMEASELYEVPEKAQRSVAYADKQELEESIIRRHYGTIVMDSEQPQGGGTSAGGIAQGIQAAPDSRKTVFRP